MSTTKTRTPKKVVLVAEPQTEPEQETTTETAEAPMPAATAEDGAAWEAISFPVALKPVEIAYPEDEEVVTVPNRKAIVRLDTKQVLNIVTDRYKLVPHAEIFRPVREAIDRIGMPVERESSSLAMGGGYARFQWDFGGPVAVREKDDILWRLTARNSYNYESKLDLELGAFRLVCKNGLRAPIGSVEYLGGKHLTGLSVERLLVAIEGLLKQTQPVLDEWAHWADATENPVALETFEKRLEKVTEISAKARESIVAKFTSESVKTVWTAYNSLTWYITHQVMSRADRSAITQDLLQRRAVEFARKLAA